ncbi:ABC transporter permease, partial [Paraburkholderia sp. BR14261]
MSLAIKSTAPGASFSEAPLLLLLKLRTFIALFAVMVFFSFAAHNFLSIENLLIMSRHVALNAFLAIGMT